MSDTNRFLDFKKNVLNANTPSICAAKWMDATIWLYSGLTASCHHPPSHKISETEIKDNPSALHNTSQKKQVRLQMQKGERPSECEYCWKIEDLSVDAISDRVFHSLDSDFEHIKSLKESNYLQNFNPKRLEIAFDRNCQFACSYCNPSYSTTWVKDIQQNGPYKGLLTDKRQHYESTHAGSDPYYEANTNPYIEAFWKWWPELKKSLKQLRITGGEPLMSGHFWKFLELLKQETDSTLNLAVNSNLGSRPELIQKLIEASHQLNNLEIYTSNEAFGSQAEYIRDGLNYELWKTNFVNLKRHGNIKRIHVMMTINGLCLFSITKLLDQFLEWKSEFGKETPTFSLNIVRWPTFQSPLVLPEHLRQLVTTNFKKWFSKHENNPLIQSYEADHCRRLIQYLEKAEEPTHGAASRKDLEIDLKKFIVQYDRRRKKDYTKSFDFDAVNWLNSIKAPHV